MMRKRNLDLAWTAKAQKIFPFWDQLACVLQGIQHLEIVGIIQRPVIIAY